MKIIKRLMFASNVNPDRDFTLENMKVKFQILIIPEEDAGLDYLQT